MPALQPQFKLYTEIDYYNIPENIRAELIEGKFYYQAAPSRVHQEILMELAGIIRDYLKSKDGLCKVYPAPFAVKLFADKNTIAEPDISVICDRSKLTDKGCSGAPDWIIEIVSPNNAGHDYIRKLDLYARAGVREYWIVNPIKNNIVVYDLDDSNFEMNTYTFQDDIQVGIYHDLCIRFSEISALLLP